MPFYLTPEQDNSNQELEVCIAEALYDVDSIVADPGAYTKEELASLHSQIVSNLEQAWEITVGSEDQLSGTMLQISQVVARQVAMRKPQEVTMTKSSQANSRHCNSHLRLNDDLDMVDTLNPCHDRLLGVVGYKTHSHYFASRMRSSWVTGIPDTQLVRFI